MAPEHRHYDPSRHENGSGANGKAEGADRADAASAPPADAGHSDADTQTQRNIEDESPT